MRFKNSLSINYVVLATGDDNSRPAAKFIYMSTFTSESGYKHSHSEERTDLQCNHQYIGHCSLCLAGNSWYSRSFLGQWILDGAASDAASIFCLGVD